MEPLIRLSTSPPDAWNGDPQEASYYCDLHGLEEWKDHRLLEAAAEPFRSEALRRGTAGYLVVATHESRYEIGLLVYLNDQAEGVIYLGIDLKGRACREPAANEALWNAANVAGKLAKEDP